MKAVVASPRPRVGAQPGKAGVGAGAKMYENRERMKDRDQLREVLGAHAGGDFAVIATTGEGEILFWSRGARRLYGWTEAEALGRNIMDLTPAVQSRGAAGEIMDALRRGEAWDGEILLRHKQGALFRAVVIDLPLPAGAYPADLIVGVSGRIEDRAGLVVAAETLRAALAAA